MGVENPGLVQKTLQVTVAHASHSTSQLSPDTSEELKKKATIYTRSYIFWHFFSWHTLPISSPYPVKNINQTLLAKSIGSKPGSNVSSMCISQEVNQKKKKVMQASTLSHATRNPEIKKKLKKEGRKNNQNILEGSNKLNVTFLL